jgi:hypothetical protein
VSKQIIMIGMSFFDVLLIFKGLDLEHMGHVSLSHSFLDMISYIVSMLTKR